MRLSGLWGSEERRVIPISLHAVRANFRCRRAAAVQLHARIVGAHMKTLIDASFSNLPRMLRAYLKLLSRIGQAFQMHTADRSPHSGDRFGVRALQTATAIAARRRLA